MNRNTNPRIPRLLCLFLTAATVALSAGCRPGGQAVSPGSTHPPSSPPPSSTVCPTTAATTLPAPEILEMAYDDRMDTEAFTTVSLVSPGVPTSCQVGTDLADSAVLMYDEAAQKLVAVGIGTAEVELDGVLYQVRVAPAAISLIMITGHSLGQGACGEPTGCVICQDGQAYSSRQYSTLLPTMGLGYTAALRPHEIDILLESGTGVQGSDSAIAYRWHQLTGEKIWVINAAVGGTGIFTWQRGGEHYNTAAALFNAATTILEKEIRAGHYTLNKMGIIAHTSANGDDFWSSERYEEMFLSMWNGFKEDLRKDIDGDGKPETVDLAAVMPMWHICDLGHWGELYPAPLMFNHITMVNYAMAAFEQDDVILGSDVGRRWVNDTAIQSFFADRPINTFYTAIQSGSPHDPSSIYDIFADGVHYNQVGYNVAGFYVIESMYAHWYGTDEAVSARLLHSNGIMDAPDTVHVTVGGSYTVVPEVFPTCTKLTYEITGDCFVYRNCMITGTQKGTGVLTVKYGDRVIATVTVNVV